MTSKKTTRRALLSSMIALLLCVSMLVGSTFAWFTDEVTSTGNIIKSGTLDVELLHGDSADKIDTDASQGAIFDYKFWEPGYTQIKYVKVINNGDLAFQYQLSIIPNELPVVGEANLADVIDVYMIPVTEGMATITRDNYATLGTKAGTLSDLMAKTAGNGILLPAEGKGSDDYNKIDAPRGEISYCIALHMQEEAGNEYQNLSVGEGFKVELLATQYTWENDSFDHLYDEDAAFLPKANVKLTGGKMIETSTHGTIWANTTFQFLPPQTYDQAQQTPYATWHADFVVSADKDIPAEAVILPGYYTAYCDNYNGGKWIGMSSDDIIPAGTQIRLVDSLASLLNGTVYVNYEEICKWGNDNVGFLCGVSDQSKGALAGTTLTVELRLYETYTADEAAEKFGDHSTNYEKGKYETDGKDYFHTIGTYTYTFGDSQEVGSVEQLTKALTEGGKVSLGCDLAIEDTTITIPAGVESTLDLNGHTLASTSTKTGANYNMIDVRGTLTVTGGTIATEHKGSNMEWSNSTNVFNVTAGGVLNIVDATVKNLGGSDMNFCVHLNNWGEVTLNVDNSVLEAGYVAVRVFNSGYDMNNVTIKNSTMTAGRCFWVHNFTAEDFGSSYDKTAVEGRLNISIFGNNNTFNYTKAAARYGFTNSIEVDGNGNQI